MTDELKPSMLRAYQQVKSDLDKADIKFWDYLNHQGNFDLALAYSKLFWPDFVQVDSFILLAEHYSPDNLETWKKSLSDDRAAIEAAINEVHVYDLFLNDPEADDLEPERYEYLGKVLLACWKAALHAAYPDRKFNVTYRTEPDEYGPTISFYQV